MDTQFYFSGEEGTLQFNHLEDVQPIIIADARTNGFCVPKAIKLIPELKFAPIIVLPAGEANKNIEVVEFAWHQLMQLQANKKNIIVNIGGGALCDVGAFAASTYMRGLPFVNIPTTLLAMTDAAFGGKNGFNIANVKNIIGTIHLPEAVYVCTDFLVTLPSRELKSGIAEIIKHALIADQQMWHEINEASDVLDYCTDINIIKKSIAIKNKIVLNDLYDTDIRQALNFGHTIGHAIEAASHVGDNPLLHGEAIMLGMLAELNLSEKIFALPGSIRENLLILKNKLYPNVHTEFNYKAYKSYLSLDKKNNHKHQFALLKAIGEPVIKVAVEDKDLHFLNN